ncbi:phage tail protein [Magnetofaba australis]|uniref:Uncharacterized protein n=1 Tax=Magnetofaba australis IT-1 TaxID=1434232 RepID=A0A1Y2KA04_9PROT|nr:phage tail protein [Magnetofaba australis]OSM08500.1 hypothetical protein MAIT1_04958 [Magnetofaba australis IT-1]
MTISDSEYQAWLANPAAARELLLEAHAYRHDAIEMLRLSRSGYISHASDSPAHTTYDGVIIEPVTITRQLNGLSGQASRAWGDIVFANPEGLMDAWLTEATFAGHPVSLKLGDPAWSLADFRTALTGVGGRLSYAGAALRLEVHDHGATLDRPVQSNLLTSGPETDNPKPLLYGRVYNTSPVLIDATVRVYQLHDGALQSVDAVRDNGVLLTAVTDYSVDLANGAITLVSEPAGQITVDAVSTTQTAADIIEALVTREALTSGDLDADAFAALNTLCPQPLGLYIRQRRNLVDAIQEVAASVGAWWGFTRLGKFTVGRMPDLSTPGDPVLDLGPDDLHAEIPRHEPLDAPPWRIRLGYHRHWTVQDADGLAGSVSAEARAAFSQEYSTASASDAAIQTQWSLASDPDQIPALLADEADASTEASRRLTQNQSARHKWTFRTQAGALAADLGDVVRITHPHIPSWENGRSGIVTALRETPSDNHIDITLVTS